MNSMLGGFFSPRKELFFIKFLALLTIEKIVRNFNLQS